MTPNELVNLIRTRFHYRSLYHFSDRSNWESINQHGLLSKQSLEDFEIQPPYPGGDNNSRHSDRARGIYNFVSLSFTPQHPMAYRCREDGRHPNQIWISVNPDVILTPGTRLAMGLANAHCNPIVDINAGIDDLDTEVWLENHGLPFQEIRDRVNAMKKIEVLVPQRVVRQKLTDYWLVH